ncbi:MAG: hypothetical protein ACTTJI_03790 [Capnocytophaga sp.]|uniref:hypothetical protein n=1 Tax=Capnocytophaga sp. TaxID=44737 RepID=UPI003FA0660A
MSVALSGVYAKIPHQYLISCFIVELNGRFEQFAKYQNFLVYPECDLPDKESNPDVSIYIRQREVQTPVVVIEICHKGSQENDFKKVQGQMLRYPTLLEGYVMNYETLTLYSFVRNARGIVLKTPMIADKIALVSLPIKKVIERYQRAMRPLLIG